MRKEIIINAVLKYYGIEVKELGTSYKNNNQTNAREVLWWYLHDKENIPSQKIAEAFNTNTDLVNTTLSRFRQKSAYPYIKDVVNFIENALDSF